jgi:hypothetical protein
MLLRVAEGLRWGWGWLVLVVIAQREVGEVG